MIFPSLCNLFGDNLLPEDFLIVASGRSPLDDAASRKDIDKGLKEFLADGIYDSHQAAQFAEMITHCPVSVDNADPFAALPDRASDRMDKEIGRASCRERGCQYGKITVVAVS